MRCCASWPVPTLPARGRRSSLAKKFAHPEWLVERWVAQFGEERAQGICEFDQRIPHTTIRLDSADIEDELRSDGSRARSRGAAGQRANRHRWRRDRYARLSRGPRLHSGRGIATRGCVGRHRFAPARLLRRSRRENRCPGGAKSDSGNHCRGAARASRRAAAATGPCRKRAGDQRGCAEPATPGRVRPGAGRRAVFGHGDAGAQS